MKNFLLAVITIVFIGVIILSSAAPILQEDADAIPAFARKYRQSCKTCHVAVPKLKAYGEDFAGNGFVFPDGEEPKRATIDEGDDRLLLQRDLPLAIRFDAYFRAMESADVETDLQIPYGLKFLSGGLVTENVSYYFYFYAYERGEVAGLEDAYLHFNNIGGTEFDIIAGQFQVSDPLFKRELRLSFEDYQIYRFKPGGSAANLTYDRGLMLTYGFEFGLDVVGQIVNGNGIPAAENRIFDADSEKAYSLRFSQGLGPVRIGAFGYYNKERDEHDVGNELFYAGGDATVGGETWELNVQYLRREDNNAYFIAADTTDTITDGGLAEFVYLPGGDESRWAFVGMYNFIDTNDTAYDLRRATASVSHLPARNLRFILEYTFDLEREKSEIVMGAMAAF